MFLSIRGVSKHLQFFQHDIALEVLHELMQYSVPSSSCYESSFETVRDIIISIARLNVFVATVITCLWADESENVGGHRPKLCNDTFPSLLPVAFAQLVHQIGAYVQQWCAEVITVLCSSLDTNENMLSDKLHRKATLEVFIPSSSRRLIAISSQWFSKFINCAMGTIHDCYILQFDSSTQEFILTTIFSNPTNNSLERWHTDMTPNRYCMRAFVELFWHLESIAWIINGSCRLFLFASVNTASINKLKHLFPKYVYQARQITLEEAQ